MTATSLGGGVTMIAALILAKADNHRSGLHMAPALMNHLTIVVALRVFWDFS